MVKIDNTEIIGWEPAIRGMRNAMNSWEMSDSARTADGGFVIGEKDRKLMRKLAAGRASDRKFMRMIAVYMDITAPLYWWKEYDTYKVGTVANSCSTMHKIHASEFTLDMFSTEHLDKDALDTLCHTIRKLNTYREAYNKTKDKAYWWQMIQLLPTSYMQRRTLMVNYEVLRAMYYDRKGHKQDEWREDFCGWIKTLPESFLITGEEEDGK